MALADYQTLVDGFARDGSGNLAETDRNAAIELAVIRYSADRPRKPVVGLISPGTAIVDLPETWEQGFSELVEVARSTGTEGPIAAAVVDTLTGPKLRLCDTVPEGQLILVQHTALHQLDAAADTIPVKDREAVARWAAGLLLDQLANLYAGTREPTIQADSADHQGKGSRYAERAKAMRKVYEDHLGIDPKRNVAAGAVVDLDLLDSRGRDRLVHTRRRR